MSHYRNKPSYIAHVLLGWNVSDKVVRSYCGTEFYNDDFDIYHDFEGEIKDGLYRKCKKCMKLIPKEVAE